MILLPTHTGLWRVPGDYRWSSYRAHAFGVKVGLWTPHNQYLMLANTTQLRQKAWRELNDEILDIETVAEVRHCANTGLVLGTALFREQVNQLRN
jgi:putative transposase